MSNEMLYRSLPSEARSSDDDSVSITGHFSTINDPYYICEFGDEFLEQMAPGAFEETLRADKISVLFEHGYDPQIGRKPIGQATTLTEDQRGARYDADLYTESSYVRDILPAIRGGDFGTSFGFMVEEEEWDHKPQRSESNPNGLPVRTIKKVSVREFSVVLNPANPSADVKVRSLTDYVTELRGITNNTSTTDEHVSDDGAQSNDDRSTVQDKDVPEVEKKKEAPKKATPKESRKESDSKMEKMTVDERSVRLDGIQERLEEIDTEYSGAELPDERQSEWDELVAERDAHERAITATEQRRAEVQRKATERKSVESPKSPALHVRTEDVHDTTELRHYEPAKRARKAYDNARRILDETSFGASERSKEDNQEHITKLLNGKYVNKTELSEKVMRLSNPRYRDAFASWMNSGGTHVTRDMSIGTDANGGFGVPFDLDPTWVLTSDGAVNPLREIARVERISGTHLRLITTAGVTVNRDGEAQDVVPGDPTLAGPEYNAGRVSGYVPFSLELGDAYSGLEGQITSALAEARAEEESSIFVTGAGDGLTGVQGLNELGTVNAGSIINVSGATGTFVSDDIYALDNDLAPRHRPNASFLANKPTYNEVRQLGSASDGGDLWVRLRDGLPPELIGYSSREMSDMESQGDSTTNPFLILGDFRKYLIVDRIGMVVQMDDLVKSGTGVPTGQRALVAFWWSGGGFIDANAFRGLTDDGV